MSKRNEKSFIHGTCPICGEAMRQTYIDYLDGWCLMEEETECDNGHYTLYYVTGSYLETIGDQEWLPMSDNRLYLWWFDHSRWLAILKEKIKWQIKKRFTMQEN